MKRTSQTSDILNNYVRTESLDVLGHKRKVCCARGAAVLKGWQLRMRRNARLHIRKGVLYNACIHHKDLGSIRGFPKRAHFA